MNFIKWYYAQAIKEYWKVCFNFVWFFGHFFSVKRLARTLFSPWKKNLFRKEADGFHPLMALSRFASNTYFRFFGALVKLIFIIIGLLIQAATILTAAVLWLVMIFLPAVILASIIASIFDSPLHLAELFFSAIYLYVIFSAYRQSKRIPYEEMSLEQLYKEKWFNRVLERTGFTKNELEKNLPQDKNLFEELLKQTDLSKEEFRDIIDWEISYQKRKELSKKFWSKDSLRRISPIGQYWHFGFTKILNRYAWELSKYDQSEYGQSEVVGYKEELQQLNIIMSRPDQNNAILIGEPGIGKTSIIHYLGKLIRENKAGEMFRDMRLMMLDLGEALSSAQAAGMSAENFLHQTFYEAAFAGNIILAIKNIDKYLDAERNVALVLDEYLALPTFRLIATSTSRNFHSIVEKRENLIKNFERIEVREPTEQETIFILLQKYSDLEKNGPMFTFQALREIVEKSGYSGKASVLPERAIDLAEEVLIYWRSNATGFILPDTVNKVLSLKTGVAQGDIEGKEKETLLNLEEVLHKRVVGQEEAIRQVSEAIRKTRAGIGSKKKPVGSFLFLGPTGVGKTETAKALAEAYFGSEERMIRFDMNEFQGLEGADRLIGSTQTNQPGQLVSAVKDNPFSLILLDEIEKAHPNILDLFLQVLDEGYLMDAFKEKINFKGTIIIATSNAGAVHIKKGIEQGMGAEELKKTLLDKIVEEGNFKLEFLNRFDDVVFFRPLEGQELVDVVNLMLTNFAGRLFEEKRIKVDFEQGVAEKIIQNGYEPIFGARSINRYIGDKIEDQIAKRIIQEDLKRDSEITIAPYEIN